MFTYVSILLYNLFRTKMNKYTLIAQKKCRLLKFLQDNVRGYSYSSFLRALRKKDIKVNGVRVSENIILDGSENVEIYLEDKKNILNIHYEDENIIVFNKPKKVEVVDGEYNICDEYFSQYNKKIFAVHRLDLNTEGLVIFAKSEEVLNILISQFKKQHVKKFYLAIVLGKPLKKQTLVGYLEKHEKYVKIYEKMQKNAQKIVTSYNLLQKNGELSLLEVEIENGKMHQIRAHLSHENLPILGDEKYGDSELNKKYGEKSQCLFAYKIVFDIDDKKLEYLNNLKFELEMPSHFLKYFHKQDV